MIDNKEIQRILDKLENLEDEVLAVELLKEFNRSSSDLGKLLLNLDTKLVSLHKLMGKFGERPNPDKDFFKIHPELIDNLFDLVDGEKWMARSEVSSDTSWVEKVGVLIKNESPKANEFQLNKLKMKVIAILKARGGDLADPTLELVREAIDLARREIVPV